MKHLLTLILTCAVIGTIFSCKTKQSTIEQKRNHVEAIHDTFIVKDTLITHDTLTNNTTTIIRELDSAQMAQYGIQLSTKERAWLIDRQQLQNRISELISTNSQYQNHTDTVRDTVATTVTLTKEVNRLYWYQSTLIYIGLATLIFLCIILFKTYFIKFKDLV